ncbi:MAG: hypothetical protein J7J76_09020 [Candidatus Latescibacteria bacterium]|nr:hypothetical protein [Candidatus Latescibacterota bacterium]
MLKKFSLVLLAVVVFSPLSWAQQSEVEPQDLVECPTAGLLPRGSFALDLRVFSQGGILAGVDVGLTDSFLVGLCFGGTQIIGSQPVVWNPTVGVAVKIRLFDEGRIYPAVAVGFDSQGFGKYHKELKRYSTKSKGFYLALSKAYSFLGPFGLHAGVNYSLEKADEDKDISGYFGLDKHLGTDLVVVAEYDLARNDNGLKALGSGGGYLNAGLRWTFASRLNLELDIKDLLRNAKGSSKPNRELRVSYLEYF